MALVVEANVKETAELVELELFLKTAPTNSVAELPALTSNLSAGAVVPIPTLPPLGFNNKLRLSPRLELNVD